MTSTLDHNAWKKLDACIHCGFCLPACPTYRITGSEAESPRGRLYLMRAFHEGELDSPKQLADHLNPCLGCLGCTTVCPSGVDYETVLLASRQELVVHQPKWFRWWRRLLLKSVLPNPTLLHSLATLTRWYQRLGMQTVFRGLRLHQLLGPLGKLVAFTPTIQAGKPLTPKQVFGTNTHGRVAMFTGCIMNAAYAQTQQATIDVLVANGYEVVIPEQTCCGALAHHSGEEDIVKSLAYENVETMLETNPDWIVVNAAGCGSTLKHYHHIVQHHEHSHTFTNKVVDIMELLNKRPLEGTLHPLALKVTYHAACHLHHAQGIQEDPMAVLQHIPGIALIPLVDADMCCGSAGVYNLAHPTMSMAILKEKMMHLNNTHADVVVTGNPGCMLQLETGIRQANLSMKVMHPVDLLAMAYNGSSVTARY